MRNRCFKAGFLVLGLSPLLAQAELVIEGGWIRAVPPVSTTTAGYFVARNSGDAPLVLEGVSAEIAGAAEMHEMSANDDGTRSMHRLREVEVGAGDSVAFAPGGKHLMLFRLARPLMVGESLPVCLAVRGGETVCADFVVRHPE